MQKFLRTLMLTVAMLLPFASQAQTMYLTVADSTATNSNVPVYGLWADSYLRCQTIYPASMLTSVDGESILGVSYYLSSAAAAAWTGTFEVKVLEVTDDTLAAFADMTGATTVYTGQLDASSSPMAIDFSTPYSYQGGNLLVEVSCINPGNYKSATFYGITANNASWQGYSGSNWTAITGSVKNFIPKTTFMYGTAPTCFKVKNLAVVDSLTTTSSITLSWIDTINTGATYSVYNMSDTSEFVDVTINGNTAVVNGLNASTLYSFGVMTDCGGGDVVGYAVTSGRTSCGVEELPFTEDFSATLSSDPCWRGASNATADQVFNGTALTLTAVGWTYASSDRDGLAAGHYYKNVYGTSCKAWMITPAIDLSSTSSPLLTFDAAFTKYNAATPAEGNIDDDQFLVIVSTDAGATWDSLNAVSISLSSLIGTTYITQYVDLSDYAGDTVKIAFYAESTVSGGDNDLHIDNISIAESTGDICYAPTNLTVSNITETGATLTWSGNATSYNVYAVTATDTTLVHNVSDTTIDFTDLTAMTSYTYGVSAVCSSDESQMITVIFNTPCSVIDLPYTETFEETSGTRNCWTIEAASTANIGGANGAGFCNLNNNQTLRFSSYNNATDYNQYGFSPVMNVSSTATNLMVTLNYATYGSTDILNFGYVTVNDTVWDTVQYTTTGSTDWQTYTVVLPATATQLAIHYYGNYKYYAWIDSVVVEEMTGDYCYTVSNLTVDTVTATSVTLSWSDENNTGATYSIYGADGTVVATGITGTTYTVTGLTALTGYTFGVVANCSETDASNVTLIDAVTACAGATCDVYIYAEDSYGDGWNGASIDVMQGGAVVANYTLLDTAEIAIVEVCASAPVSFLWNSGNYDYEASFMIIDVNGDSLFAAEDASDLTDGAVFFNLTAPCGEVEADSLTVVLMVNDSTLGSITPAVGVYRLALGDSITLTATPFGDNVFNGWLTYVDGEVLATLPINPFAFSANEANVNHTMLMIAQFAAAGAAPDSVTIIINVDNPLMGTTSPAPGTYRVAVGDPLDMVALPNAGFHNLYWIESATIMGTTFTDTLAYDTLNFFASPIMANATLNYTAYFEANPPVESTIDASEITYWVGEGSNQAVLAINWPDTALAWGYRFNGTATVQDMIEDIAEADPRFSYTIENGYLSDFTFVCENGETLTGANAGYWESKNNGISDAGMAQTLSNGDFEKWANSAAGIVVDSIYYEGWGWSYIYNYPMTIHPVSVPQGETVTITFTVNDASMGTITPSGVQTYHVGETLTVTATPYAGYQLVAWQITIDGETQTVTEDITTTYTDAVIPEVDGAIITAVFQRETGIDDVEAGDIKAYSVNSRIVVKDVENMNVNIYDVTGRVVYNEAKAAETVEFTVPSAGVYMVKAGDAPAKRVVVVR